VLREKTFLEGMSGKMSKKRNFKKKKIEPRDRAKKPTQRMEFSVDLTRKTWGGGWLRKKGPFLEGGLTKTFKRKEVRKNRCETAVAKGGAHTQSLKVEKKHLTWVRQQTSRLRRGNCSRHGA